MERSLGGRSWLYSRYISTHLANFQTSLMQGHVTLMKDYILLKPIIRVGIHLAHSMESKTLTNNSLNKTDTEDQFGCNITHLSLRMQFSTLLILSAVTAVQCSVFTVHRYEDHHRPTKGHRVHKCTTQIHVT